MDYGYGWRPYVPVAAKRARATRELARLGKRGGRKPDPVTIEGRTIARSFWGKAWCDNLERYSDFENRLPRGRTYVRNGSVVDLEITPGKVMAQVAGSELYRVEIAIRPLSRPRWKEVVRDCTGQIGSLVELLAGRFSSGVMEVLVRPREGLFPEPREIEMSCSCPDWATMCKHVAATLYGVGARLDDRPELFFALRQVDQLELCAAAGSANALSGAGPAGEKRLEAAEDLSALFGIDLDGRAAAPQPLGSQSARRPRKASAPRGAITSAELIALGIPRSTFQNWVTAGHLRRTDRRGAYLATAAGRKRIATFTTRG
jgi:uncharacterized Zn finger protein